MDPDQQMMLQILQGQQGQQGQAAQPSIPPALQAAAIQQMAGNQQQPASGGPPAGMGQSAMASPMVAPDPASMTGGLGSPQMSGPQPTPPQGLNGMDPTTAALFSQIPSATGGQ